MRIKIYAYFLNKTFTYLHFYSFDF